MSDHDNSPDGLVPRVVGQTISSAWQTLQQLTQARIAIGRSGDALPTTAVLAFEAAQSQARDAVHTPLDTSALIDQLTQLGLATVSLSSSAPDRATYLRRPDAGRRLSTDSRALLTNLAATQPVSADLHAGVTIVIADGLSATAPLRHAAPLLAALMHHPEVILNQPVFVATQARVALGDEIGACTQAHAVLILIGERPGLTTPDSLGAYLTWEPRVGRTDAERNCVSNIHANGLSYAAAAYKVALLLRNARQLGATGINLHDEADGALLLP